MVYIQATIECGFTLECVRNMTVKYFVIFSFQIFCAKNFSANRPLHTVELSQTR